MVKSFLRTAFERVAEARQRRADDYVNDALLSFDNHALKALGMNREELRRKAKSSIL